MTMNPEIKAELAGLSARLTAEVVRTDRLRIEHVAELPEGLVTDLDEMLDAAISAVIECERLRHGIPPTEEEGWSDE